MPQYYRKKLNYSPPSTLSSHLIYWEHNEMYTVITVILNANVFAIGSAVSLRESERPSKFRHGSIIHQVFLILVVYVLFHVIPIRKSEISA